MFFSQVLLGTASEEWCALLWCRKINLSNVTCRSGPRKRKAKQKSTGPPCHPLSQLPEGLYGLHHWAKGPGTPGKNQTTCSLKWDGEGNIYILKETKQWAGLSLRTVFVAKPFSTYHFLSWHLLKKQTWFGVKTSHRTYCINRTFWGSIHWHKKLFWSQNKNSTIYNNALTVVYGIKHCTL